MMNTPVDFLLDYIGSLDGSKLTAQFFLAVGTVVFGFIVGRRAKVRLAKFPVFRYSQVFIPFTVVMTTLVGMATSQALLASDGLLRFVLLLSIVVLIETVVRHRLSGDVTCFVLRWIVAPLCALQLSGLLPQIAQALDGMAVVAGNLKLTVGGILRVVLLGAAFCWLGWISVRLGQSAIRRQERFEPRLREVIAKLLQVAVGIGVFLILLRLLGINLTTLAVFGGALGVGLGFGLQSIASNFLSGIIILFDRSLSIGDYIELEEGTCGVVRELNMRYTTLESYDGKSVVVPNDTFITTPFRNWTHKHPKQRYRVDFSVAYHTDVRALCEVIKTAVSSHPQVLSGDALPIEERADCEIDSFGESGINMFVEFWMVGVDDGRNRVGGDLLLMILETLRENHVDIPFPQREVKLIRV